MGSPRVPPNAAGEILLPRGGCTELGKLAVCILGSLGPRDPGGKEAGGGTSRDCGSPRALSKKSPKLLLGDKAGRTGGAGSFGEAWMPLALSQTQHWLWAAELPKPHLSVAPQTSLVRLLLLLTPFLLSSTPRPNRPHGWSRPPPQVHRCPHTGVDPQASSWLMGPVETQSGSEQGHPQPSLAQTTRPGAPGRFPSGPGSPCEVPREAGQEGLRQAFWEPQRAERHLRS